jgi:hypothetical protein
MVTPVLSTDEGEAAMMETTTRRGHRLLETVTNVALIGAAIAIMFEAAYSRSSVIASAQASGVNQTPATYVAGDAVEIKGVNFASSEQTLVFAIQSSCHFCKESLPFYAQVQASRGPKTKLVAVAPDSQDVLEAFAKSAGFIPDHLVTVPIFEALKVYGTPTLLLVNRNGVVKQVWVGRLSETRQREVLAAAAQ